jgi:hypothetical protein
MYLLIIMHPQTPGQLQTRLHRLFVVLELVRTAPTAQTLSGTKVVNTSLFKLTHLM